MTKQAQDTKPAEQKEPKAAKEPRLEIPLWLIQRAQREGLSRGQMLAYAWLFHKNRYGHIIYGKHTLTELWIEMRGELLMPNATKTCQSLEERGWIAKAKGEPYKGRTMKGYRCLLGAAAKADQRAEQQELQLRDEECETVVESVVPPSEREDWDGMYHYGGEHWYEEDGERHYVPAAEAYRRPSPRHVWDSEAVRWCLPEEVTVHPLDF